jgi:hypothetical protein
MKLNPEIEIVETIKQEKQIKELTNLFNYKPKIKNNRKTTRGRKKQIIVYQLKKSFPPILKVKIIIH